MALAHRQAAPAPPVAPRHRQAGRQSALSVEDLADGDAELARRLALERIAIQLLLYAAAYSASRSEITKVVPTPSLLETCILPPYRSTIRRAIARPRPLPRRIGLRATYSASRMCCRSSFDKPGPLSCTRKLKPRFERPVAT